MRARLHHAARRVRPGDGRPLARIRWWQIVIGRAVFHLHLNAGDDNDAHYSVEVWRMGNVRDGKVTASLYLDGRQLATSALPASFPVGRGAIEVAASSFGLRRCRYVSPAAPPRPLSADPRSAEGRRARLDEKHPSLSRGIAVAAILLLVVGVGLNVVQLTEIVTHVPAVAARFGSFDSPVHLPVLANILLGLGAAVASAERALRLRYSWLDAGGH